MNVNDGGDNRGMNDEEGEQQVKEEMGEAHPHSGSLREPP
jgi:hypothetical protein